MANNSTHIPETLEFHPTDTPRGMEYYNLPMLTPEQQTKLNEHKINIARANQKYLFEHPEIRAVLQIITRKVLLARPTHDVQAYIGNYFKENWDEIEAEINTYTAKMRGYDEPEMEKLLKESDLKHVFIKKYLASKTGEEVISHLTSFDSLRGPVEAEETCREIIMEIIEKVEDQVSKRMRRLKISSKDEIIPEDEEIFARLFGVSSSSLISDDPDDGIELDLDFDTFHEDEIE